MNIIKKIKAFFIHQDEPVELDLVAAEIKEGKAFLHPRGEENITYLVKSDDIDIILNKGRSLEPKDILKVERKHKEEKMKQWKLMEIRKSNLTIKNLKQKRVM